MIGLGSKNNIENIDKELKKPWAKSRYKKFPYSPQKYDFGNNAYVRLIYNDGSVVQPLSKNYNEISRKDMKSVSVVVDGKPIYTLQIKDNQLVYRRRNIAIPFDVSSEGFAKPKRCFILATKGKIAFVWDSGEVKELTEWGSIEPYTRPNLRPEETKGV